MYKKNRARGTDSTRIKKGQQQELIGQSLEEKQPGAKCSSKPLVPDSQGARFSLFDKPGVLLWLSPTTPLVFGNSHFIFLRLGSTMALWPCAAAVSRGVMPHPSSSSLSAPAFSKQRTASRVPLAQALILRVGSCKQPDMSYRQYFWYAKSMWILCKGSFSRAVGP